MAHAVIMPRQGQSVESCILTSWFKQKGDRVEKGELLFSYETDKAAFDEEAKVDGVLLDIFFKEGDEVPVLTNIAAIGKSGEPVTDLSPDSSNDGVEAKPDVPESLEISELDSTDSISAKVEEPEAIVKISPRAKKLADKLGVDTFLVQGSGPGGRIIEQDIILAHEQTPKITPLAREMMKRDKLIYDKEKIRKRVTRKDLKAVAEKTNSESEMVAITNIRRRIAKAMHHSLQNSAQLTHHTSADASNILKLREKVKAQKVTEESPNITLNDMVCFSVVKALKLHPAVNGHFLGEHMKLFRNVNLGIAVDTKRGLMVPTLREAEKLSLEDLSAKLKDLAARSKKGNIDPDLLNAESAGFTVSNLGAYGVEMFTPVINLPQIAILGVNTIINRPANLPDGTIGLVPYIGLSLTYDHRALDGGPASLFLKEIKHQIENFET